VEERDAAGLTAGFAVVFTAAGCAGFGAVEGGFAATAAAGFLPCVCAGAAAAHTSTATTAQEALFMSLL